MGPKNPQNDMLVIVTPTRVLKLRKPVTFNVHVLKVSALI